MDCRECFANDTTFDFDYMLNSENDYSFPNSINQNEYLSDSSLEIHFQNTVFI